MAQLTCFHPIAGPNAPDLSTWQRRRSALPRAAAALTRERCDGAFRHEQMSACAPPRPPCGAAPLARREPWKVEREEGTTAFEWCPPRSGPPRPRVSALPAVRRAARHVSRSEGRTRKRWSFPRAPISALRRRPRGSRLRMAARPARNHVAHGTLVPRRTRYRVAAPAARGDCGRPPRLQRLFAPQGPAKGRGSH